MKKRTILFVFIFVTIAFNAQQKKVLFIGNSYTFVNDLPSLFADVATSLGEDVLVDSSTGGGMRLMDHASSTATSDKIQAQEWDYVILQAQSQEPSWPLAQLEDEVFPYAITLNDIIKSNYACSETVFFMTWGRKNGDYSNCADWPPVCTFEGMQERLMAGYMTMAAQNNATCAPVGLSWKTCREDAAGSEIELYSSDSSHPSIHGSYLTACVFYASLFHKSPIAASYPDAITEGEALLLQEFATETVLSKDYNYIFNDVDVTGTNFDLNWRSWYENGNMPIASFEIEDIAGLEVNFTDESINAETILWDFGDGASSTETHPTHVYESAAIYNVVQSVTNECATNQSIQVVDTMLANSDFLLDYVKVYPNPSSGILNLELLDSNTNLSYKVMSTDGHMLTDGIVTKQTILDMTTFASGVYFLELNHANNRSTLKLILN